VRDGSLGVLSVAAPQGVFGRRKLARHALAVSPTVRFSSDSTDC
jgi:hypothetical protein